MELETQKYVICILMFFVFNNKKPPTGLICWVWFIF